MTGFLGNSNAFLGVLVTLIVLCILSNGNNFIHEILKEIKEKIHGEIGCLKVKANFSSILNLPSYKLLQIFISKKGDIDAALLAKALELDLLITTKINSYQSSIASLKVKPALDTIDLIHNSKEQILSPLFALMVAIVTFMADEWVNTCPMTWVLNVVATFLTIFVGMSWLFMGVLWLSFVNDVRSLDSAGKSADGEPKTDKWFCRRIPFFTPSRVGFLVAFLNPVILVAVAFFELSPGWGMGLYLLSFLPILMVAFQSLYKRERFKPYSYEFVFKHFVCMLALAVWLTVCVLTMASFSKAVMDMTISFESFVGLKYALIAFVMVAGLILPFVGPYWAYIHVLSYAKRLTGDHDQSIQKEIEEVTKSLEEICNKIPVADLK